ncbi:MAG: ATP-binding cassette domain-containing protein, partial [Acidimicrobiales bacterium]|nr:ATP-binding cassette domain-containing protein [Acidimicrobiales bacterium]
GPNGAGKTTLIRLLLGLTSANSGSMSILGMEVPKERERALARVGAIVDEPRFFPHLSGKDNLRYIASARGKQSVKRIDNCLNRVGLSEKAKEPVKKYSLGMRGRLGIAACLLGDPELLILDEPMNGLDPAGMQELRAFISSFIGEGRTVILSSHLLDEVEKTCQYVAIVDSGKIVVQSSIAELAQRGKVQIIVSTSQPEAVSSVVSQVQGVESLAIVGETLVVTPLDNVDSKLLASTLNKYIITSGYDIFGLSIQLQRLEERFLEVTHSLGGNLGGSF